MLLLETDTGFISNLHSITTDAESPAILDANNESENPDLEDGEIEDDDEEIAPPPAESNTANSPTKVAAEDASAVETSPKGEKRKLHGAERKVDKHMTEAEKCVRMLHRMERAERERERRERSRRDQDDWAGNVEKAIASVLKKEKHTGSGEEEEEEEKRGRKRKKRERVRKKKHKKIASPKPDDNMDEDEMLNVRGGSPENKTQQENSPFPEEGYDSYDSDCDSESYHNRPNKRNFDRERKNRTRNRESRRERKNFREKNRKKENEQQNRPQLQDANNICMFYMQGKCHKKGEECPYSHDVLPPMKLELCKFYLMECCAKRDKCLYMHSEFPCKYYHTGLKCFAKENCKFAHGKPLSDSLKQVLLKHLETAPKEILGDFPRLSREGAQHMVNQTQKNLEVQYGIKNNTTPGPQNENVGIPSLFDITVPVPPELMLQQQQQQQNHTTNLDEKKSNPGDKSDKPTKVRHTRWNDEPAVPVQVLNQAFTGNLGNVFNNLTPQDQQKIYEYQQSYQMKGFYSEQDQDMRINSNGDVDMRALPQVMPAETPVNFEQYKQEAGLSSNNDNKMDVDIRNYGNESSLTIDESHSNDLVQNLSSEQNLPLKIESNLTINEKLGDSMSELPSNLPKKQRELFLRIQAQQKENLPENQNDSCDTPILKDDDWYSSDDDNDPLSKMVIHLEEESKDEDEEEPPKKSPERTLSPAPIKPVEVIDKLGDLSKIDISAEVTKLLTSITSGQINNLTASSQKATDAMKSRDPRQAKLLDTMEITSPVLNSDPRSKAGKSERRDSRPSIYELGIVSADEAKAVYEGAEPKMGDVDLRKLDVVLPKDLDMRPTFGDTDLRQGGPQDVDLRQLNLPFKAIQNYTPATEIDASIGSHSPINYKVHVVDIPRPNYSGLKLNSQDPQVLADPRLRKIFRVSSVEEKDSPASPKQQSPPKVTRQDPRRRTQQKDPETKPDVSSMSYSQQLQLLQKSVFYQTLTSNQKVMLNQEIASKSGDQNASNDPVLSGILSILGLIPSLSNANGNAMNILANVNSLVPQMGPGMMMQGNPMGPNMGPGLLGAAPNLSAPNEFPINFDPRNGGLLGEAPFQNFPDNFQYNEPFYQNEDPNYNSRNDRNFRNERNPNNNNRRGRAWNNRNNARNYNRNNNRNRSNRSYTPP